MSQNEVKEVEVIEQPKKTRKTKAPVPTIGNRSTRRAKRKDSSDQCALPQIIPRNQFAEVVAKQSFESQTTRLILQIPLSSFVGENFDQIETTRVENMPLEIRIYRQSDNLICSFRLPSDILLNQGQLFAMTIHGKYSWLSGSAVVNKPIKSVRKTVGKQSWEEGSRLKIGNPVHSDMFIVLALRGEEELCFDYQGLVNQGNTCYMNSYLQMLFHIPQFRRLIFGCDAKESDRFPAALQLLFYRMLTEDRAVSPEELIKSFGWFSKMYRSSVVFFSIFWNVKYQCRDNWEISQVFLIFSVVRQRTIFSAAMLVLYLLRADFRTENIERFYDLFLPLAPTIAHALDDYVSEQYLDEDNLYRTDEFGLQQARKGLRITKLPPILMLQLKRFQYNYQSESNEKKLQQCKYPEQMDFGRWTADPTSSVPYLLYAVLVHQGSYASSGHYYVLIKVQNQWIKFNDERVEKASREKALHYNYGGNTTTIEYDSKQLKINVRSLELKATAYMLVYVNKDIYSVLFQDVEPEFPQWLIEQTKNRQYMEQEKKTRKQSICDLSILRWSKHYQGKQVLGLGLSVRQDEGDQQKIDAIPKSQKVEEWLHQIKQDAIDRYVYIYWVVQDREVLISADSRGSQSVKQLFNQVQEPTIVYAPILVTKQQYLIVLKVFNQNRQQCFIFEKISKIMKNASIKQLYGLMVSLFPGETLNNYYLQDKKIGLVKIIQTENNLIPAGVPSRNQLLIVVVEQLKEGEEQKVKQWYKDQMDNMFIQFKHQQNKQFSWQRSLNKHITVEEIREIIFQEILNQNSQYQSARNIVIKYRAKKNTKVLSQANDSDMLKDIIKIEKVLHFSYSTLSINDRLTQKQLIFYYREDSRRLSDPQKIVIDKSEQSNLAQFICNSPVILSNLPPKSGHAYRLYLLAKDRSYINDIVDQKGYVPGKGDLMTVLQRQKSTALVIQQYEIPQGDEEFIPVLIHHVTKTGERIGNPRWQYTQPSLLLSNLKYYILDLITDEMIQFEGKGFQINPMKVRVLAYVKQWTKAQDLPQNGQLVAEIQIPDETVHSKYGTPRQLRIGIIHSYISKSVQALKLNVQ